VDLVRNERPPRWMDRKAEEGVAPGLCVDRRERSEPPPGRRAAEL
jgi:hypothetical protein